MDIPKSRLISLGPGSIQFLVEVCSSLNAYIKSFTANGKTLDHFLPSETQSTSKYAPLDEIFVSGLAFCR